MKDVLEVCQLPFDEHYAVIWMDEKRNHFPMQLLKPERRVSEYVRKGTYSIFVFT